MFRFENNMPQYWEEQSRDLQLLTRIDDVIFMGQRSDIATIQNLNSSKQCKNNFLTLLAKKVGFFTNEYIEDKVLRNIIGAFRMAVKHKGTYLGIMYAVTAILKAENNSETPRIEIDNTNDFKIDIYTPLNIKNVVALKEFLKYIIPAGFTVNIYSYAANTTINNLVINNVDTVSYLLTNTYNFSKIRNDKTTIGINRINNIPLDNSDMQISRYDDPKVLNYMKNVYAGSVMLGTVADVKPGSPQSEEHFGQTQSNKDKSSGVTILS